MSDVPQKSYFRIRPVPAGVIAILFVVVTVVVWEYLAQQAAHTRMIVARINAMSLVRGMHEHHEVHHRLPTADGPGHFVEEKHPERLGKLSWRVHLLPYLGEQNLYERFRLDEPWDSAHNKQLIPQMPSVFGTNPEGLTRFHVFTASDGSVPFSIPGGVDFAMVQDTLERTIAIVEAGSDKADYWTKPGGLPFDSEAPSVKALVGEVEPWFLCATFDGRVHRLPSDHSGLLFLRGGAKHADGTPMGEYY